MIQSAKEIKEKDYVVFNKIVNTGNIFILNVGTILKVKKFNGSSLTFVIKPIDKGVTECAKLWVETLLKMNKIGLEGLKSGLKVWEDEPDKFVFEKRHGVGDQWWHMDGKICDYSYLKSIGYFESKDFFERAIPEKKKEIESLESGQKDKYYEGLVKKHKFTMTVEIFNEHINEV